MGLGKTLAELEHIPHDELVGWQAFYHLEPWGSVADDHRASALLDLTWAVHSKPNNDPPRWFDRDPQAHVKPDPTPEELADKVRDFFMGKTVKVAPPEKKPRRARKDKGSKRAPKTTPPPAK
ncbi:hypothetical protein U1701_18410 [Sphingomonas sp. PB2P19]|uniref:phage tail assembly protein T n=1 Tax=Sphingomonas rhamnosi TaxID=3096156 RepID=UPI002FC5FBEE